jgi:hypothetical protein
MMHVHPSEKKPTWWQLYALGVILVATIGVIETSVPNDSARVALEVAAVALVSLVMLGWLRINRVRIDLARARPPRATSDTTQPSRIAAVHSAPA